MRKFGDDFVAQHWGTRDAKTRELRKYTAGMVEEWACPRCGFRNDPSSSTCQASVLKVSHRPRTVFPNAGDADAETSGARTFEVSVEVVDGYFPGMAFPRGTRIQLNQYAREFPTMANGSRPFVFSNVDEGREKRGDPIDREVEVLQLRKCRFSRSKPISMSKTECRSVRCGVLLLGTDGAEGIDLPCTTHIILLDKIFDPRRLQQ